MKKIAVSTVALSAIALMTGCGSDGNGANNPGGNGTTFTIATVTGEQLPLAGNYSTSCYDSPNGRIDSLNVTNTTWNNSSVIYTNDTCTGDISAMGSITGFISKGADKQTSGWTGQGGVVPQRADATGSLSENETVTSINLIVTEVDDSDGIFGGNVNVGFEASLFYVFDDTAGGDTYIMYRDDDGDFASASDPYVFTTHGAIIGGVPTSFNFPVLAISGTQFEFAPSGGSTLWSSGCYIGDTGFDSEESIEVADAIPGVTVFYNSQNYQSSDGTCIGTEGLNPISITYDLTLDGTTEAIIGWSDSEGAVQAPQKQDGTGLLTDTESYSNMTATVTNTSLPPAFVNIGDVFSFNYIVDDSTTTAVLYSTNDDGTGDVTVPLILQQP